MSKIMNLISVGIIILTLSCKSQTYTKDDARVLSGVVMGTSKISAWNDKFLIKIKLDNDEIKYLRLKGDKITADMEMSNIKQFDKIEFKIVLGCFESIKCWNYETYNMLSPFHLSYIKINEDIIHYCKHWDL